MNELNTVNLSKEAIASRMFRNAAKYWGYNDTDIDNFDPLVRLLIEACSLEVFKINNEINTVQQRMLEKLAKLLTPEILISPKPAHAIIHARSTDTVAQAYPAMQFFHNKKVASKPNGPLDSNLEIYFSPSGNFSIYDGDVKYIATGSNVYTVNSGQYKETFLKTSPGRKVEPHTVWIGVELNNKIETLQGLSFFFDLKNLPQKDSLLQLLPYSKWSIDNSPLTIDEGLWDASTRKPLYAVFNGLDEFDTSATMEKGVNRYYKNNFVTISSATPQGNEAMKRMAQKYPVAFENIFSPVDLALFTKEIYWLKVVLPAAFDEQVLDELSLAINCFPVMNRRLIELRYRLQSHFNIIPLANTNEQFLDIKHVQGIDGKEYVSIPVEKNEVTEKGTFTLRNGGVERFDGRNATEHLNYLLELLRDESAAFAAFGQDFIASIIKDLNQNISQIEQKVKQKNINLTSLPSYLLIKPREDNENIFVEYWTTNGEQANTIRSGTLMNLYKGSDVNRESLLLATSSNGGEEKPKSTELVNVYRNTMMTRGRIVTLEDIKSTCHRVLVGKLNTVDVKRGTAVSHLPDEGLIRTIDVFITPAQQTIDEEEWYALQHDLRLKLEQQSTVFTNYRIFLKN